MEVKKKKKLRIGDKKDLIFYCTIMAWPVLQFCVFYIGVNLNSFLLAFKHIDLFENTITWTTDYFFLAFETMFSAEMFRRIGTSLLAYCVSLFIGVPLGLLFSYYIYKKMPLAGMFRVILFMPSIISSIVMVMMYKFFVTDAFTQMVNDLFHKTLIPNAGLLGDTRFWVRFPTIMFYNVWVGFGTSVLMYSNKMSSIDPSISEAASMDGAKGLTEFIHVTFPMVFSTVSVFLITGVAQIFTNQINLYSFLKQRDGVVETLGYWLFAEARTRWLGGSKVDSSLSELAAISLILTAVAVPITFAVKGLIEKFGPSED